MKLNDMIFVIENRKGTVEANFLLTLDDTIEMLKQSGEYSMKETAAIFSELGRTMTEPDWAEVYLAGNKTLFMCYCRDESHLSAFLNKKFNDENVEDVRFDYERCSLECKEKIRLYGIAENGEKDKMVEHHYSHMEHQFKQGENLHNFNGKDYKVVELLSPRNLLLMDMSNGNFVVGLGTSLFMRQIKGDSEEPEIGIEWEHGVYLSSKPSRIDFQGIREDYGGTKMEKDREDIRLEQEDYFTQLHKLANNALCSEDIRELLSEIMRAEFCTDKMDKFHQNLSAGIYDDDSELKVFPVTVCKDMQSVLSVRGIDMEDIINKTSIISYKNNLAKLYKPTTVNSKIISVNKFLKWMGCDELKIKTKRIQTKSCLDNVITREYYLKLLDTAWKLNKKKIYYIMKTIAQTGIRVGELKYVTVEAIQVGITIV